MLPMADSSVRDVLGSALYVMSADLSVVIYKFHEV